MNSFRYPIAILAVTGLLAWIQSQDGIAGIGRHHPGHQMKVEYIPAKSAFEVGSAVEVTLRITNVGQNPFMFIRGGRQRGARNNQFAFNAQFGRSMLPDVGDPVHFGGIGSSVLLKPGEQVDIPVDLTDWFSFEEDGTYMMRGSYYMDFIDPESKDHIAIWQDFACAEFTVILVDS